MEATNATNSTKPEGKVHPRFNGNGADLIVQSCDGVQFHLHRRYLEVNTGAFPGTDAVEVQSISGRPGDVTYLPEPASVLEVVFEFVYPRKHVTMFDQPSTAWGETKVLVLPIAEAAEKYEVYPLMAATIAVMRTSDSLLVVNKDGFLAHAVRHDYPDLADRAALVLAHVRGRDLERLLRVLPDNAVIPWICYQQSWREIFTLTKRFIGLDYCDDLKVITDGGIPKGCLPSCKRCEMNLLGWVANIETQFDHSLPYMRFYLGEDVTDLREQLHNCQLCCKPGLSAVGTVTTEERQRRDARDFTMNCIKSACKTVIDSMPSFSQFMKENCRVVRYRAVVKKSPRDGDMGLSFQRI
ncbi:hypothetical protein D9613_001449 [Agrocybe pediades]|uniref:BTB domain-containing protein n=1 Tax=Agrocybe pediades TaxID=84607 RepID=A0A8H4R6T1_9AGAR|nr:hypothetical protein D9613_001449 [Agrocybe pediades]